MVTLKINGEVRDLDIAPEMPLLWAIRENFGLTGTKFGCGIGQCGACTVRINGTPMKSCVTPVAAVAGAEVTTIEGLTNDDSLHPVQEAWIAEQVPQCGYCQSGQIMSAVALLETNPNPNDDEINQAMSGNVCRCGMYGRIRRAIKQVASGQVQTWTPASKEETTHG